MKEKRNEAYVCASGGTLNSVLIQPKSVEAMELIRTEKSYNSTKYNDVKT